MILSRIKNHNFHKQKLYSLIDSINEWQSDLSDELIHSLYHWQLTPLILISKKPDTIVFSYSIQKIENGRYFPKAWWRLVCNLKVKCAHVAVAFSMKTNVFHLVDIIKVRYFLYLDIPENHYGSMSMQFRIARVSIKRVS